MSWNPAIEPGRLDEIGPDAIETLIVPRSRDLGGFEVRRALPAQRDRWSAIHLLRPGRAGRISDWAGNRCTSTPTYRPWDRHISLSRRLSHRDSTGADQIIRPGALNWMVAGRGVTHSERTTTAARSDPNSLFGIQTWLALPDTDEDVAPSFELRTIRGL